MTTTTNSRICTLFNMVPFNLEIRCKYYKSDLDQTTNTNTCRTCKFYR